MTPANKPLGTESLEWIDAMQEVPDDDRVVLILRPDTDYPVWPGYYDHNEIWTSAEGDKFSDEEVTGWAEMPGGPAHKESDDDDD